MASVTNFIIRCKTENGSFTLRNINGESSVQELKMHLSKESGLKPECIKILCGYPPKALADDTDNLKLKEVNINSGETIIIEKKNNARSENKIESSSFVAAVTGNIKQEKEIASGPLPSVSKESVAFVNDFFPAGIMMRRVVPSNNSCLFTSVSFILSQGKMSTKESDELRKVIAEVVSQNPEKYTDVFLGMPNKEYCTWIQNTNHWGGAIELSILSEYFGFEIVAVDTINLKMHRFGENANYPSRIFLIYDGIHYDPLVFEVDSSTMLTCFSSKDDHAMEMAMEIAKEAKSSRQYTDVANFTLQCSVCGERMRGEKEARQHASATGHLNFGEVTD